MSNVARKRSSYFFDLSDQQSDALVKIALQQDRPFEEVVLESIDRYIEQEKKAYADDRSSGN
jgi:hypothetical protein